MLYSRDFPDHVKFQISYENDKWTFDYYYDVSGTTLQGEGKCISSKTARGKLEYPSNYQGYSVFFQSIEE